LYRAFILLYRQTASGLAALISGEGSHARNLYQTNKTMSSNRAALRKTSHPFG
jgi:hypothetical protein